jgi:hypothetical protein
MYALSSSGPKLALRAFSGTKHASSIPASPN